MICVQSLGVGFFIARSELTCTVWVGCTCILDARLQIASTLYLIPDRLSVRGQHDQAGTDYIHRKESRELKQSAPRRALLFKWEAVTVLEPFGNSPWSNGLEPQNCCTNPPVGRDPKLLG